MAQEVCIFDENKPGRLARIAKILKDAHVNMRAINITISQGFGIIKLIVDNPDKTIETLRGKGLTAYTRKVIAILMDDQPGGLYTIAKAFAAREINIEDGFGFVIQAKRKAVMIIDVEELPEALEVISESGFSMLTDEEIYNL
ncbi:MAG: hypothetical protein JXD19_04315 [Deltaproteobacteria bacterium]|nr:hypothetical protein [Deltaproteobacteria bacterium]